MIVLSGGSKINQNSFVVPCEVRQVREISCGCLHCKSLGLVKNFDLTPIKIHILENEGWTCTFQNWFPTSELETCFFYYIWFYNNNSNNLTQHFNNKVYI